MLKALGDPLDLLFLLLGFLLAVTLQGFVQAQLAQRFGDPRPRTERRTGVDPRRHIDPFGAVGGLICGLGWLKPLDPPDRRRRGRLAVVLLSGPLLVLALGIGLVVAFTAVSGSSGLPSRGYADLLQFGGLGGPLLERGLLLVGLSLLFHGTLALVPLPPLAGGHLLLGLAPSSPGWRQADYQLVERNIGIAVLLALLLIPLGGPLPLLPQLLDTVLGPLVALITGGA